MKTKLLFAFWVMMLMPVMVVSAQSFGDTITQNYSFGVDSMEKEIVIDVPSGCEKLYVRVDGSLQVGKCKVIILNSSGVWKKDLQLGYYGCRKSLTISTSSLDAKTLKEMTSRELEKLKASSGRVNGVIDYQTHQPDEGMWKVLMLPEEAEVEINVSYSIQ